MDLETMKRKYATLAGGAECAEGPDRLVEAAIEGWQFASLFAEECYKLGAGNVVVNYLDQASLRGGCPLPPDARRPPGGGLGAFHVPEVPG